MRRVPLAQLAALAAAALLGGGAALAGAALAGALDGGSTTTVVETERAAAAAPAATRAGGLGVNEIYRRAAPGVVQITTRSSRTDPGDLFGGFGGPPRQALGSGFVIDRDGHVVTSFHVIDGADEIDVSFSDRDTLRATVVGTDQSTDLAVLRVNAGSRALTPLPLGDSDEVQVGDPVVAIGNPFGLERTATAGIVSALQRAVTAPNGYTIDHVIQTDAPINQGSSGGPLLNAAGEVIGVNSQIETRTGGNVGIGFAVPSNTVRWVVAQILENGRVDRAYLGISARAIEPELARLFRLPVDAGLLVERVEEGSAADTAGLRGGTAAVVVSGESYRLGGDLIVAADGRRVTSVSELREILAGQEPGGGIELEIYRGDEKRTLAVELGREPPSARG